jgi:hypothetical protein
MVKFANKLGRILTQSFIMMLRDIDIEKMGRP